MARGTWIWATVAAVLLATAGVAQALSPEEVIKLKKAGVSDETIRMMMEQERGQRKDSGWTQGSPVRETDDMVIYGAGQNSAEDARRMEERERRKEDQSMRMLPGIIMDQRGQPAGGQTSQPASGQTQ